MKRRKRPRRLETTVRTSSVRDIPFAVAVHQLPAQHRPSLLARSREGEPASLEAAPKRSLRRRGHRRPTPVFYQLNPTTGTWERL